MSRKLFFILLVPTVLLVAGYLYLHLSLSKTNKTEEKTTGKTETTDSLGGQKVSKADLRPLFITRMQQLLKKSSNGLYDLTIGDMTIDVLTSTIALLDVTVKRDEIILNELRKAGELPQNIFDLSFQKLVIDGINIDDAITSKTMDYRVIRLVNPVIHVYRNPVKNKQKESPEDFSQRFLKEMTKLAIERLAIEGGTIISHDTKNTTNKLNEVSVNMNNVLLDSTTRTDKSRFLFAKEATISFSNYVTQTKDGLYTFRIGRGTITAPQQQASLQNLSFTSPLSREQFMKRQKIAKELYNLTLASATLSNIDWWALFNGEELAADEMLAKAGKLTIYCDRSLPPRSRVGNFPNQLLAKLPLKMKINTLRVQNLDLAYTEYNPGSKQTGTVYLDNIELNGTNLSTTKGKPVMMKGTALLMHKIPLSADFTFNMRNPESGAFTANILVDENFEGGLLNAFTVPLGMLKVEQGSLQKLQASMKGDQSKATGNVLMLYKDLKIHLMEKDKGKAALDKKNVTTFLANLFVIKNDNPKKGSEPRKETASYRRDANGGFFMLIWKTVLVGALKTIGVPEKLAYKKETR